MMLASCGGEQTKVSIPSEVATSKLSGYYGNAGYALEFKDGDVVKCDVDPSCSRLDLYEFEQLSPGVISARFIKEDGTLYPSVFKAYLCNDYMGDIRGGEVCTKNGVRQLKEGESISPMLVTKYPPKLRQKEIRVVYSMDVDSCLDVDYERLNGCSSSAELSKLSAALGVFGGGSASKGSAERERARSEAWRACFRERPYNIPSGRLNAVLETGIRLVSKGDKSFYYTVYDDPEARATKKSYQKVNCNFAKAIVEYSSSVSDKVDELEVSIGRNQF